MDATLNPTGGGRRVGRPRREEERGGLEAGGGGPALKVLAVLETMAEGSRPLSIPELSVLLDVPKPTMHRIVRQLEAEGFLQREPRNRLYGPGPRLLAFALGVVRLSAESAPRHAVLETLSQQVGETCNFGIMSGNRALYLDRVEAAWPFGLRFEPGSRVPLHCTSLGKLFLSALPRRRRDELLKASSLHRYTENTIIEPDALERELQCIQSNGYAIDNQEFLAGVVCISVPVKDDQNRIYAGIAVSAPLARMPVERAVTHLTALREAAVKLAVMPST